MDTLASRAGPRADLLRNDLRIALAEWGVEDAALADDHASLIQSGALDSVALFNLSMWIESQVGSAIDPSQVDVARAWDSIDAIVRFILAGGAVRAEQTPAGADAVDGALAVQTSPPTLPTSAAVQVDAALPDGYAIERLRPDRAEDIEAAARLFALLWSDDLAFNERLLRWKYLQGESAAAPFVYLVWHEGHAVAMRAMAPSQWQAGGLATPVTVMSADDFIVDEAHRNHGLFAALQAAMVRDAAALGHRFFLSMSALRVTRLQALAAGSRSVPIGPPLGVAGRWAGTMQRAQAGVARLPGGWRIAGQLEKSDLAERAFAHLDEQSFAAGARVVQEPPVDAMAQLVARLPYDGRIRQLRDAAMLSWRFAAPLYAFRFVLVERDGRLAAYVALSRAVSERGNRQRVSLVDWAAEDADALAVAVSAAAEVTRFADLVGWGDRANPMWTSAMGALGAVPFDIEQAQRGLPCILVHAIEADAPRLMLGDRDLLVQADWDLRMSYTAYG